MTAEFTRTAEGKNKVGTAFKVLRRRGDKFGVFKLGANYDGKVRGGISHTWRYLVLDVSEAEAMATFAKALAGKAR
jgi:hypothetical protein